MTRYGALIARLDAVDVDSYWFGPARPEAIASVEAALGCQLPGAFRDFLAECGGGGADQSEISGIAADPTRADRGTVLGDTQWCRERFGLPGHLVVVRRTDGELCWCIDTSRGSAEDRPVVAYDISRRRIVGAEYPGFEAYFREYVEVRTAGS
jgi:hypothetical protein